MALLLGVGVLVFWPALTTPYYLDDYLQSAMVHGRFPGGRGPFNLYDFVADDNRATLLARGFLPWWAEPGLTLRFLRPLSSALLYCDHRWLEAWPMASHLVSFAWWMGAVFAARAFFRLVVTPRAAVFATVIFALAPCHALAIGWLANREALVALCVGTVGLVGFLRWREEGGHVWALVSLLAFALALGAGEYALGFAAYVLVYAVRSERRPRRFTSVLLFAVPAAAYLLTWRALGYGSTGSGFYQDPIRDPGAFLLHAPWRFVSLVFAGWFTQDTWTWQWGEAEWPVAGVVLAFVVAGVVALRHVTSQQPPDARRTTWTLAFGSVVSLAPVLAVLPSVRLLGVAMLGIAAVIGTILDVAWFRAEAPGERGVAEWTAIAAMLLGFAHFVHGPGWGWVNARQTRSHADQLASAASALATRLVQRDARDVVVVRGLDDAEFFAFAIEGLGVKDVHWTVLAQTGHVLAVRRDDSTLELTAGGDAGLYLANGGDLFRSERSPLSVGDGGASGGMVASIEEMNARGPRKARFHFDQDLDDVHRLWVSEKGTRRLLDASPGKVGFGLPLDP